MDDVLAALRRADARIPRKGFMLPPKLSVQCIVERYGADFAKSENEILNLELLRRLSA